MQQIESRISNRSIDAAINLEVSVEEVTARMLERGRDDDTEEAIAKRLGLYESQTRPLLEWFSDRDLLLEVDGLGGEDEVFARVQSALDAAIAAGEVGEGDNGE